jgi:phosphoribosyl 1,2-cyclic phosphodiesterase
MSLYIASLNSGSNGNCYYIGSDTAAVFVDAGISCRKTEQRMMRLGLSIRKVKAIFISHEHTDHTRGAEVLSRKYGIPVYISKTTFQNSRLRIEPGLVKHFRTSREVSIGGLCIHPFPKSHDASEPHSFTISSSSITTGVFTDIGTPCKNVIDHLGLCHAAFLESNYDEEMLETGRYPAYLKKRIRGDEGHLSNDQALKLFTTHKSSKLQLLVLSHLSAENNRPQLVHELFSRHSDGVEIVVASRYEETKVFCIREGIKPGGKKKHVGRSRQLSLFEDADD